VPKLSILIAAHDDTLLEATLVSVLQNRPADCEIVVVHNEGYHDPYDLAGEVRLIAAAGNSSILQRLDRAVRLCQSPVVHILRCGAEVTEGWTEPALLHFGDPTVAAVAPLVLAADGHNIAAAGVSYRFAGVRVACQHGLPVTTAGSEPSTTLGPTLDAGFYRTSALSLLRQPFCPLVGESLADVDLALRLARAGYRAVFEPRSHVTGAADRRSGSPLHEAWLAERLFWRHASYGGGIRTMAGHLGLLAQEAATTVVKPLTAGRLLGRGAGLLERLFLGVAKDQEQPAEEQKPAVLRDTDLRLDPPVAAGLPKRGRRHSAGATRVA